MYLQQPGFTCSACGPFNKNKERTQKFKNQSQLDKACFQHDMAYGDFKGLTRRTTSDKVNIAKNPKYDEYQLRITPMVYKCFDKKSSGGAIKM